MKYKRLIFLLISHQTPIDNTFWSTFLFMNDNIKKVEESWSPSTLLHYCAWNRFMLLSKILVWQCWIIVRKYDTLSCLRITSWNRGITKKKDSVDSTQGILQYIKTNYNKTKKFERCGKGTRGKWRHELVRFN